MTPGRIRSIDLSPDGTRMLVTRDGSDRPRPSIMPLDGSPDLKGEGEHAVSAGVAKMDEAAPSLNAVTYG